MTDKKPSVKSVCEEAIRNGKSAAVIMNSLRKKFPDRNEEQLQKSVRYYASALFRAGEIDEDQKGKYVGQPGRGNKAKSAPKTSRAKTKPAKDDGAKRPARKAKAKAEPAKAPRRKSAKKDAGAAKATRSRKK